MIAVGKIPLLLTPEQVINQVPSGVPFYPGVFDGSNNGVLSQAGEFFTNMSRFINFITHPILIVNAITGISYWLVLIVGAGGLIFYIAGNKKGLKYVSGSLLAYILLQTINKGLSLL